MRRSAIGRAYENILTAVSVIRDADRSRWIEIKTRKSEGDLEKSISLLIETGSTVNASESKREQIGIIRRHFRDIKRRERFFEVLRNRNRKNEKNGNREKSQNQKQNRKINIENRQRSSFDPCERSRSWKMRLSLGRSLCRSSDDDP
jgi:hypothetical protein